MWKNNVKPGRPQVTIWRMRIACWIPKSTNTDSEYVILTAFPLQQFWYKHASMLQYTTLPVLFILMCNNVDCRYYRYLGMSFYLIQSLIKES
jgi:hypothetical protein